MNCFNSNSNSTAFLPRSITGELSRPSELPKDPIHWDALLGARLLLSPSPRATFLGIDQDTCGAGVLVQYADQSGEAIDRDLLFWPILNVAHNDLESGLRRLLMGDCTTKYREDNRPLGLRAEVDHR
jgi:hypothetical protein